jgi:hypothetical protein
MSTFLLTSSYIDVEVLTVGKLDVYKIPGLGVMINIFDDFRQFLAEIGFFVELLCFIYFMNFFILSICALFLQKNIRTFITLAPQTSRTLPAAPS